MVCSRVKLDGWEVGPRLEFGISFYSNKRKVRHFRWKCTQNIAVVKFQMYFRMFKVEKR